MKLSSNENFNIIREVEENIKNVDEKLFVYISHKNSYICEYLSLNGIFTEDVFKMNNWYLVYRTIDGKIKPVSDSEIINKETITKAATHNYLSKVAASIFISLITTIEEKWSDFLLYASLGLQLYRKNGFADKIFWKDFCDAISAELPKRIWQLDKMGDERSLGFK